MITQKLTETESTDHLNSSLWELEKGHRNNEFDLLNIADHLPVGILINSREGGNIYQNKISEKVLNLTLAESRELGPEYSKKIIHSMEEYNEITAKVDDFYRQNDPTAILSFFQRLKPIGANHFEWTYITSKLYRHEDEQDYCRLLVACPVKLMGDMAGKIDRMLDENTYMKKYFKQYAMLTKREKEVIRGITTGNTNIQIADQLFISRHTVEQHRKNINRKLDFNNISDLMRFARAFELDI